MYILSFYNEIGGVDRWFESYELVRKTYFIVNTCRLMSRLLSIKVQQIPVELVVLYLPTSELNLK